MKKKRWFIVIGRIPFDDEDSAYFYKCLTQDEAVGLFTREIYEDSGLPVPDDDPKGEPAVFIIHILSSTTKPRHDR